MAFDITSRPTPSFIRCSIILNRDFLSLCPLFPYLFGKLYFHHYRTYLQEPPLMPATSHQVMSDRNNPFFAKTPFLTASPLAPSPLTALAQPPAAPPLSSPPTV